MLEKHGIIEKNSILMVILILIVVSIGGLVQIVPLFYLKSTIEKVEGMRPYSPLELAGRNIYIREGCYLCHSQMIRALRDEVERYGHYSLAAESMYDHPFQWGSKRTGPDLARLGNKYSDEWHRQHLINPRDVVPESIMPGYSFLQTTALDYKNIDKDLIVNQTLGTPYTEAMIKNAKKDLESQANPEGDDSDTDALEERYGMESSFKTKIVAREFDGDPKKITEMDALIAYLQMLGTLVDFTKFDEKATIR